MYNNNLTEDIIESINNIETVTVESEMNVLDSLIDEYHKSMMIYENYRGEDIGEFSVYQEGFGDTVKKGLNKGKAIFIKIWNMIKKLFSFISRQIMRVINFVKRIFKKGNPKSTNQILDDMGVKPEKSESSSKTKETQSIPSNPISTTEPPSVKEVSDSLICKFQKDGTFTLSWNDIQQHIDAQAGAAKWGYKIKEDFESQKGVDFNKCVRKALHLVKDEQLLEIFEDVVNSMKDISSNKSLEMKQLKNLDLFLNKVDWEGNDYFHNYTYSVKDLESFQKRISTIALEMVNLKDPDLNITNTNYIPLMHKFINVLEQVQMGLNSITATLQHIYVADMGYKKSIKDINKLDQFVNECIKAGIPSKYVGFNAWYVSADEIKGPTNSSEFSPEFLPIWGQSRIVFFPPNKNIIYKVALSGMGLSANITETKVTNNIEKDEKLAKYICPVLKLYENKSIIEMGKVKTDKKLSKDEADRFKDTLNKELSNYGRKFMINDIHLNNVGIDSTGNWVCFDYGMVNHR